MFPPSARPAPGNSPTSYGGTRLPRFGKFARGGEAILPTCRMRPPEGFTPMASDKRIALTRVKCPTCKLTLLIKPGVKVCPACRTPLPQRQKI
jgi:hypothetical protein